MRAVKLRRSIMLGVLLLGFGTGATPNECDAESVPSDAKPLVGRKPIDCSVRISENGGTGECVPGASGPVSPAPAPECSADVENPCMRYLIPLVGDPNMDAALRAQYVAAFGPACYTSEPDQSGVSTFNCFYKSIKKACADAVRIGQVSGNAAYDPGYMCQAVGNGDYTLQIGPDPANKLFIYLKDAPRQSPLIEVNGVPTIAVNGPYRNLPELEVFAPGGDFSDKQRDQILQANRNAHKGNAGDGEIHSDLVGFEYPCDGPNKPMCKEPLVLQVARPNDPDAAQVHHVARRNDERCCPWGTNSNTNAAVISRKLNRYLWYRYPAVAEVLQINTVTAYPP